MIALLLRLSLTGSLLAAVLFLLKPLLRGRISRAAAYYLWLLVLLRLCVPAGLTLPLPELTTPAPAQISTVQQTGTGSQTAAPANPETPQPTQTNPTPGPSPETARRSNSLPTVLFALWAAGAAGVGGWYVTGYLRVRRTVQRTAVPAEPEALGILAELSPQGRVRLVESGGVNSPLLLGVFHPTIVLPVGVTDPARLRDILSHELTHARRQDLLVKWFAALAASIHWFNPLLLLVRREIGRACELACDEAVVKTLDAPARKHYGETLLALAAEAPVGVLPLAVTLCEEKETLQERLVSIVKIHRRTPAAILLTVVLVLALGGCALFTGASAAARTDQFRNPDSGAVLRLGMTKEETEALIGQGSFLMLDSEGGEPMEYYDYGSGSQALQLGYAQDGTLASLSAQGNDAPFVWTSGQGIGYGSTWEEVQRGYPEGRVLLDDALSAAEEVTGGTAYQVELDGAYLNLYLTDETGVLHMKLIDRAHGASWRGQEYLRLPGEFTHLSLGMTRQEAETLLGEGRQVEEFPGYLRPDGERKTILYDNYGAGEDAVTLGYLDGRVCVIYANGKFVYQEPERSAAPFRWTTARGIGYGSSLEEVQAQYPGEAKASPDVADYLGIEDLTVYTVEKTEDYSMELYLSEGEGVWSVSLFSAQLMTQEELERLGITPLDDWNP